MEDLEIWLQETFSEIARFRYALETLDKRRVPLTLAEFPLGSCGDVCEILAEHLKELGCGLFDYVMGIDDYGKTHAWLEQDGVIIDITADQFPGFSEKIYICKTGKFYEQFSVQERHKAGYSMLDEKSKTELEEVHVLIKTQMNTAPSLSRTWLSYRSHGNN